MRLTDSEGWREKIKHVRVFCGSLQCYVLCQEQKEGQDPDPDTDPELVNTETQG